MANCLVFYYISFNETLDNKGKPAILKLETTFPGLGGIPVPFSSTAERLFWDNVAWNSRLAACRTRGRRKAGWRIVTADEVLEVLEGLGISIDRRTLSNYVKWGLVSPPDQRSGGRGVKANFPEEAVSQAAVAAELLQNFRWKKERVRRTMTCFAYMYDSGWDLDAVSFDMIQEAIQEEQDKLKRTGEPETALALRGAVYMHDAKLWFTVAQHYYRLLEAQGKIQAT